MKINQLKIGVVLSYATQAVHVLSGLIYTPVMLRFLGQSEYGLYQLVASVVAYLSLLGMGFSSGYMRFYSRYKADNEREKIAQLNGMFILIFSVIATICMLCGVFIYFNAETIFGSGLTTAEISKAKILLSIMVINMAITLLNSVFTCYVTAHEKFSFQRGLEFLRVLVNPFLTLPLLLMGIGSIGVVMVSTILTVVAFAANIIFCGRKLEMEFCFKGLRFNLLREIWGFTFLIFLHMIIDQINWNVDKFLLGRMVGVTAVAIYGVAGQLKSMYTHMSTAVSGVFIPRVNKLVIEKDNKNISALFVKVGRIQFIILSLIISCYVLFGKEFIKLWAGNEYTESYVVGLFLMVPTTIHLIQNLGLEIQRAKNMHRARVYVYLFISIGNILLSIPLIKMFGPSGAAAGTAIALLLGDGIFMNWYYHKKIGIDIGLFWKEILGFFPAVAVSAVIGIFIRRLGFAENMVMLMVSIIAYTIVYMIAMWLVGMNSSEKKLVINLCKKISKR